MRNEFLPFSRPSIGEDERVAVDRVLHSGWITTGPEVAGFEHDFRKYCGSKGAVAVNSATAGLHLVLTGLDIGPGDEVITPSMTWVSTVNMIVRTGATPVFVDVDRDSLMTGVDYIEPFINSRTRLIIPVHFGGAAVDMEPLRTLAARHGIGLVEDAAHAAGTESGGEKIGGRGTAIFSFHPNKNMTTGEGGMICSDDEQLLHRVRTLRFHGLGRDAFDRKQQGRAAWTEVMEPGFKYNMTDIAAVLGRVQLRRLDHFIRQRNQLACRYRELLNEVDEVTPLTVSPWTSRHAWHLFIIRLDADRASMSRDRFMDELQQRNIGTGLHFRAVHEQHYFRQTVPTTTGRLAATEWNSARICSLPLFPAMTTGDVDDVVSTIKEVLRR